MRRALLVPALLWWTACGSNPTPVPSPTPTPPPPGGPVTGRYRVEITPAASCAMARGTLSFPVEAGPGGTSPHRGVQVLLVGDGSQFELEFLTTEVALRGGVGTVNEGVICNEGLRAYIHAIGAGPVFRSADGRGQVLNGTLSGTVALSEPGGAEGDSGTCTAADHTLVLRAQ